MRLVCYLGTRGCPGILEEAFRDNLDPVTIAVPIEPRLLGPHLDADALQEGLQAVAHALEHRAEAQARDRARRAEEQLASVFGQEADPCERIHTRLLDPPMEEEMLSCADELGAERCLLARDALDILGEAGVPLVDTLASADIEVVTR